MKLAGERSQDDGNPDREDDAEPDGKVDGAPARLPGGPPVPPALVRLGDAYTGDDPESGVAVPVPPPLIRPLPAPEASADVAATQPAGSQPTTAPDPARVAARLRAGLDAWKRGELLAARTELNRALHAGLPPDRAKQARDALADIARRTLFSRTVLKNDPLVSRYRIRKGDALAKIGKQFNVSEDLLAEINALPDKNRIVANNHLKVVHGPFHAAISKSDHRMHVYLQDVYICTYRVALGTDGTTPTGQWKVANHQTNPSWTDPRTSKKWYADDPNNPIGEYWIGLQGIEGEAAGQFGYGVHGTIEPETIGTDVSMGCIRLAPKDIAVVYRLLVPGASFVTVYD